MGEQLTQRLKSWFHVMNFPFARFNVNPLLPTYLEKTRVIIWDESPMASRYQIEAFDRSLRVILLWMGGGRYFPEFPFSCFKPDGRLTIWDVWAMIETDFSLYRLYRAWHWARSDKLFEDFEFSVRFWARFCVELNPLSPFWSVTICKVDDPRLEHSVETVPYGGKILIFGGDFR